MERRRTDNGTIAKQHQSDRRSDSEVNFKEDGESPIQSTFRLKVSRSNANKTMENKIKNDCQWFPGWIIDVSDALSWDDNRSDNELINIFRSFTPSQIPDHFKIVPLPR